MIIVTKNRIAIKRSLVFFLDNIYHSLLVFILILNFHFFLSTLVVYEQSTMLQSIFLSLGGSLLCGVNFTVFKIPYLLFWGINIMNTQKFERMLVSSLMTILVVCIRSILVIIYQVHHDGFSKAGRRIGLRVVNEDGKTCSFLKLLLRNFARFSGGFSLFFIPCILPAFDKSGRSMFDMLLRVKIVEEKYRYNSKAFSFRRYFNSLFLRPSDKNE